MQNGASIDPIKKDDGESEAEDYGVLRVERQLIVTKKKSIAIRNVASLEVDTERDWGSKTNNLDKARNREKLTAYTIITIVLVSFVGVFSGAPAAISLALMLTLALAYYRFRYVSTLPDLVTAREAEDYFTLTIRTNAGSGISFRAPKKEIIDTLRKIISNKMNERDSQTIYNINLESGTIETINASRIETATIVQGDNNKVATGSPGARVGTNDSIYSASNSPGAVVGDGNVASGNATNVQKIDYGADLLTIEQWRSHFAKEPNAQELERRLAELEALMRHGTPTREAKSRLRDIVQELTAALNHYGPAAELFARLLRLTGF